MDFNADGVTDFFVENTSGATRVLFFVPGPLMTLQACNSAMTAKTLTGNTGIPVAAEFSMVTTRETQLFDPTMGRYVPRSGMIVTVAPGTPVPHHYAGFDSPELPAVFNSGMWMLPSGGRVDPTDFGQTGDVPVPADYFGAGRAQRAVIRRDPDLATLIWYVEDRSQAATFRSTSLGVTGDIPLVGDFDRNGFSDVAVYRPGTNTAAIRPNPFRNGCSDESDVTLQMPVSASATGHHPVVCAITSTKIGLCTWENIQGGVRVTAVDLDGGVTSCDLAVLGVVAFHGPGSWSTDP